MENRSSHVTASDTTTATVGLNEKNVAYTNILTISRSSSNSAVPQSQTIHNNSYHNDKCSETSSSHSLSRNRENPSIDLYSPPRPVPSKPHIVTSQNSYEDDVEAQRSNSQHAPASASKTRLLCQKPLSDPMWPNRQDLKLKKRAMKRERACCTCWASMNRKQRSIISTIIILVILGSGMGVGFGISKRVGGGVVNIKGTNSPILLR